MKAIKSFLRGIYGRSLIARPGNCSNKRRSGRSIQGRFKAYLFVYWTLPLTAILADVRLRYAGTEQNGARVLEVEGPAPKVYAIETSVDLQHWALVKKDVLLNDVLKVVVDRDDVQVQRYFRAVMTDDPPYRPGVVLLRYRPEANSAKMKSIAGSAKIQAIGEIETDAMKIEGNSPILSAQTELSVPETVENLKRNPEIEFAEPDYILTLHAIANDSLFVDGAMWGMYGKSSPNTSLFGSQVAAAWKDGYVGSRAICVGVIDSGIQVEHPDLRENIWVNPYELTNGLDDDGNGKSDDVNGWNFPDKVRAVFGGNPDSDEDLHGTHVAGTIGAVGGNAIGVAGVNWQVSMISGKIFKGKNATLSDAINAIDYFTDLKRRHHINIVALNNSWGVPSYSQPLHEAIIRAANQNILFVASAGNDTNNIDVHPSYPAALRTLTGTSGQAAAGYEAVVSVAALDQFGDLARFSNYGPKLVDLAAPGVDIWSTVPGFRYGLMSGTSMAAPHVSGAIALYASTHPEATAEEIRAALLRATTPTPSLAGKCVTGGRLDLSSVIKPADSIDPPIAPSGLSARFLASDQVVELTWVDNAQDEDGFRIEEFTDGAQPQYIAIVPSNTTSYRDRLFAWSAKVNYRVTAVKSGKSSVPSNVAIITTPRRPRAIFVDGTFGGGGADGSQNRPFASVSRAYSAATDGDTLAIRAGIYRERLTFSKQLKLQALGGAVLIAQ